MSCNKRISTIIIGIIGTIASSIILYSAIDTLSVSSDPDPNDWGKAFRIILIVLIGFCSFNILFNLILMHGAVERSRFFLLPWLIYNGVGNCSSFALCIVFITSTKSIGGFVSNGISWALWAVVLRFYMELSKNRGQGVQQQEAEAKSRANY